MGIVVRPDTLALNEGIASPPTITAGPFSPAASWQANDIAVAVSAWESGATFTPPTGWTQIGAQEAAGGSHSAAICYRQLTSADLTPTPASWSFTVSTAARFVTSVCALGGAVVTGFLDSSTFGGSGTASTNLVAPALTTVASQTFILTLWTDQVVAGEASTVITAPTGTHTPIVTSTWNASNGSVGTNMASLSTPPGTQGSFGPYTATCPVAGTAVTFQVAFVPISGNNFSQAPAGTSSFSGVMPRQINKLLIA